MADPLPLVELKLQLQPEKVNELVDQRLLSVFDKESTRLKFVDSVLQDSDSYMPLAKLSVEHLINSPDFFEVSAVKDRLSAHQLRFFNLALQRVKSQRSEHDKNLGLAAIALVAIAGPGEDRLSFGALKGALLLIQSSENQFGAPLSRLRISNVTRGWIEIEPQWRTRDDSPLVKCFTPLAQTYLLEECPELFDRTSDYCSIPQGRDFAGFCLQEINDSLSKGTQYHAGLNSRKLFFKYAVTAWPQLYKQFSTDATKSAAVKFFQGYCDSVELQKLYLPAEHSTKSSVSHGMHISAMYDLWELVPSFNPEEIDVKDAITGRTPLMVAVEARNERFLTCLISHNADPFLKCKRGESALWLAVLQGNIDFVRALVNHGGADLLNERYHDSHTAGQTVLMLAIRKHNESKRFRNASNEESFRKILEILASHCHLSHGLQDDRGRFALHHAAALCDGEALGILLSRALCRRLINAPEDNIHKRTALMNLMIRKSDGMREIFEMMIKCGASVDGLDSRRRTVLHYAVKTNLAPVVERILEAGGQIDAQDEDGRSPLHIAAIYGCGEVASHLLLKAAPETVELRDNDQKTALQLASICGNDSFAGIVAQHTRVYNVVLRDQKLIAAISGDTEMDSGVVAGKYRILKYQELHMAVENRLQNRVKTVLLHGMEDCNAVDIDGNTALHLALQLLQLLYRSEWNEEYNGKEENLEGIIWDLVAHHCVDVSLHNHVHETALDLAQALATPNRRLCDAIAGKIGR